MYSLKELVNACGDVHVRLPFLGANGHARVSKQNASSTKMHKADARRKNKNGNLDLKRQPTKRFLVISASNRAPTTLKGWRKTAEHIKGEKFDNNLLLFW